MTDALLQGERERERERELTHVWNCHVDRGQVRMGYGSSKSWIVVDKKSKADIYGSKEMRKCLRMVAGSAHQSWT